MVVLMSLRGRSVAVWHCPYHAARFAALPTSSSPTAELTTPARGSTNNAVDAATIIASAECTLTLNRLRNVHKPAAKVR